VSKIDRHPSYKIRNYATKDFDRFRAFYELAFTSKSRNVDNPFVTFEKKLKKPGYSPANDLFIAEKNGEIIGFVDLIHEIKIGRVILNGFVLLQHRRKGLSKKLMLRALDRARELRAELAHVCISEKNNPAKESLLKSGFHYERCFFEMEANLERFSSPVFGFTVKDVDYFSHREESHLASLQNKVFSGSWGFCPNTVRDIQFYLTITNSRLKDILVIKIKKKAIAYLWFHFFNEVGYRGEKTRSRIHMFGVDPVYRGKGLGKRLLVAGLERLEKKGIHSVELTVGMENKSALSLYESLGFRMKSKNFWYEKKLY